MFLDALSRAEPSLHKNKFWRHVAKHAEGIDKDVIELIVDEIFELDDVRTDEGTEEFAGLIAEAALEANSNEFPFEQKDCTILKERLIKIHAGRKGLQITMKAAGVVSSQDHVFIYPKIVTDIRPVFNAEGNSVDAAVIVHNLKIHYGVNSEHKDFYVALDTNDIQSLRDVLDRADAKAKSLQGIFKTSGISNLEAEE